MALDRISFPVINSLSLGIRPTQSSSKNRPEVPFVIFAKGRKSCQRTRRTVALSIMHPTSKLGKYSVFMILYIVLCLILVIVKVNYRKAVETIHVVRYENLSILESNGSFLDSDFHFDEEPIVQFEDLDSGNAVREKDIQRKFRRVYEICERYNITENLVRKHFLYNPVYEALYCWIRKVASTSFTKFFLDLSGRRVAGNYYRQINFLAPSMERLKSIINNTRVFKFMMVRHPFQRLVSSYRDRIEDNSRYTAQAWMYAPRIFHLTRPELFHSNGTGGNALQHIFHPHKQLKLIPTFPEFVAWLLNVPPENDDVHWNQYHKQCSICNANFDYILDLDKYTLSDVIHIFHKLGLNENRTVLPKLQSTRGGKSDFARTCQYFARLSRDQVRRLYERYRIDFEMFDYKYEDYAHCNDRLEPNE